MEPLPYTYRSKAKSWYFRHSGLQCPIRGELGSVEFSDHYAELMRLSGREWLEVKSQPRFIAAPDEEANGKVYFLGWDGGPIKVGLSLIPMTRLYQAQTYSPYPLKLWATCDGGMVAERRYHKRFAAHRLNGEWFERCPEIEAEIERLNSHG